jgi:hypothetical protein
MQVLALGFVSNVKIKGKKLLFLGILSMIHTHINMLSPTTFSQHKLPGLS